MVVRDAKLGDWDHVEAAVEEGLDAAQWLDLAGEASMAAFVRGLAASRSDKLALMESLADKETADAKRGEAGKGRL